MSVIGSRARVALAVALLPIVGTAFPASSAPISREARADVTVSAGSPDANRDEAPALRVRGDGKLTYVRFSVPTMPADEQVSAATLVLASPSGSECRVQVLRAADDTWAEDSITWADQPGSMGSVLDSRVWSSRGFVSFDVSEAVVGPGAVGFVLRHAAWCDLAGTDRFASGETPELGPRLVVSTAPGGLGPATILVAAGDIACDPASPEFDGADPEVCQQGATGQLLAGAGAIVPLGDLQYPKATLAQLTDGYDRSWGLHASRTFPVPGNHEYDTPDAAGYFEYWASEWRPTGDAGFYTADLGSWRLIVLNSAAGCCEEDTPQDVFLEQTLAASTERCVVAAWHHPLFNSGQVHGQEELTGPFWDDLYAAGADLVLNGHEHNYQRYAKQDPSGSPADDGIREFVVGSGGRGHYGLLAKTDPNFETGNASDFGVLRLSLFESSYAWEFVGVGGAVLDRGGPVACN